MEKAETKRLLMTIEAIYPNFRVNDLQITLDAWHEILSDQNSADIFAALKHYARTSTSGFAPNAGQLIQLAYDLYHKSTELSPSEAWGLVYKAICRATYYAEEEFAKFPESIKRAVGSPWQLRAWAQDSTFNEGVASSNFRKAYATVCERQKNDALMAPEVREMIEAAVNVRLIESEG